MRKALVVGIDYYEHIDQLYGCVNDAHAVKAMLDRHADGSVNFGVHALFATGPADKIKRSALKDAVKDLFGDDSDVSLLYFAGHGHIEATGGYICASDCREGDDGLALSDIMKLVMNSKAKNKIIILDSCHSGALADGATNPQVAEIAEGVTILTASTKTQYAAEHSGAGLFTGLLVDALGGAAANLIGEVTPGGVYAHVDQSLGPWRQRPVFKTNVKSFVSLRRVVPPIALADLRRISEFFPEPGFAFELDPAYEPEHDLADPEKNAIFRVLQAYNRVNLLVPIGAPHMWHAAMQSKTVQLTALGEHYRHLAADGLI